MSSTMTQGLVVPNNARHYMYYFFFFLRVDLRVGAFPAACLAESASAAAAAAAALLGDGLTEITDSLSVSKLSSLKAS